MDATITNKGEVGQILEVDDYGRVTIGNEYSGETVKVAFEVVDE